MIRTPRAAQINMAATSVFFLLFPLTLLAVITPLHAATFTIVNQCTFTVWAAAVPSGGGTQLNSGQTWTINAPSGTTGGRIWARTGCSFDASGNGNCQTGDCSGKLACTAYGSPPNTIAEFSLNQYANLDFYDISNIDGYNVGIGFSPETPSGGSSCRDIRCADDIIGQCPEELKAPGGCNNACTVFKTDEYCCNSGSCGPTDYSNFFKFLCPDADSYPKDDESSSFNCPAGMNFTVTFCP